MSDKKVKNVPMLMMRSFSVTSVETGIRYNPGLCYVDPRDLENYRSMFAPVPDTTIVKKLAETEVNINTTPDIADTTEIKDEDLVTDDGIAGNDGEDVDVVDTTEIKDAKPEITYPVLNRDF